jgi:hypothetical protein
MEDHVGSEEQKDIPDCPSSMCFDIRTSCEKANSGFTTSLFLLI